MQIEWRNRLRLITDLVFVSAMTILILNFNIPEVISQDPTLEFWDILLNQSNHFEIFIISFLTIGVYWVKHLEFFAIIKQVDQSLLWIFLCYLMIIMLLPIANLLFGLFPDGVSIRILFSVLMIIIGGLAFIGLQYAQQKQFIDKNYAKSYINNVSKQLLNEPLIALIGIFAALINPDFWDWTFVLIPIFMIYGKKYKNQIVWLKSQSKK